MDKPIKCFSVFEGENYRVLKTRDFGKIVFGCPPGIVKDFAKRNERLPSRYVIPYRIFIKGRNYFECEFIIYTFLFTYGRKQKIFIYCQPEQEKTLRVILGETLFGPEFHHLIDGQFRRIAYQYKFTDKEKNYFANFLRKVARDRVLWRIYDQLMKSNVSDKAMRNGIRTQFESCLKGFSWLTKKKIPGILNRLTENYLICGQLRREMELFGLAPQKDRNKFIDSVIDFIHFDKRNTIYVSGVHDKRKKLKIIQVKPSIFKIYAGKDFKNNIDISKMETSHRTFQFKPIQKPWFGVTFLGVGSGFSPRRKNSCLVAWSEGKGIMVDVLNDSGFHAMKYGITDYDVNYTFLTHVHSDHDGGMIEKILHGQRVKLISTRIIFESFLRKMEAITCFPKKVIESLFDFIEVEPQKPVKLPGFKNTFFTFDYSLHSIPSGRFILTYKNKGVKKIISHSGDTKYDVEKINSWFEQGILSKKRKQDVLGFIWDADLVIHDVGGGSLHTEIKSLNGLDSDVQKRTVLVHQHEGPLNMKYFKFAKEGETRVLLDRKDFNTEGGFETVREMNLSKLNPNGY